MQTVLLDVNNKQMSKGAYLHMILHDSLTSDSKRIKVNKLTIHIFVMCMQWAWGFCSWLSKFTAHCSEVKCKMLSNNVQLVTFTLSLQLVAVVGWAGPGLVVLPYAIFRKASKSFSKTLFSNVVVFGNIQ